jgi:hypothetical protein
MAAPRPRLRKQLSAPGLLQTIRQAFEAVPEHRHARNEIPLADALMSGLAVFGLKYPSLLKFDEAYHDGVIRHNLQTLYGVERAPCDTPLRTILDPLDPAYLRPACRAVHRQVQRHKALEPYRYWDGYYLVSIDGTGQFASSEISCPECCCKTTHGQTRYYHQLLGAVIVHPDRKTGLPLAPEAITRQDGARKNDGEANAAKRLLPQLRQDYPHLKWLVVEDSLAGNGPHLELLQTLKLRYLIHVKPGDHAALFAAVQAKRDAGAVQEWVFTDAQGVEHGYGWVNDLPLNKTHPQLRVNFLEYWEKGGDRQRRFSWITDIELTRDNDEPLMRGGRARWKVENETFHTLKNQGDELEHNDGHGQPHLATVFAYLMRLAFLVDQVQERGCRLFPAARAHFHSRTSLWERLRALFTDYFIPDWKTMWEAIASGHVPTVLAPDTS